MCAIVARSAAGRRGFSPGGRAARVTHALLVIAVAVVPPGVRGTCAGCPLPGGLHACCAGPTAVAAPTGAAAAVAATHFACGPIRACVGEGQSVGAREAQAEVDVTAGRFQAACPEVNFKIFIRKKSL